MLQINPHSAYNDFGLEGTNELESPKHWILPLCIRKRFWPNLGRVKAPPERNVIHTANAVQNFFLNLPCLPISASGRSR